MKFHFALSLLTLLATQLFADTRPNIIIMLADDLGYGDVGFTGNQIVETPNLDRLANEGVIFQNGYVTHPYCGPSRAGLITGRYQARFGMEINLTYSPYDIHSGLPLDEKTFGQRLQPAGYQTGIIGKWHLGASYPFHPNNRGFDYFYGFLSGGHDYFPDSVNTHHPLLLPDGRPHYSANEGVYQPLLRNTNAAEFDEYLTTALSKDAARFVKDSDKPFCLYLAYNAPHASLEAPKEVIDKYSQVENKKRRTYLAMIDAMDQGIGIVIEALKESGKFDNTLIFFLSDNGGVQSKPGYEHEVWADNGPLRNGKGSMREGGSHVPFIAHWPKGLPSGIIYPHPVSSLDLSATAVALAGGDTSGKPLDGVNLIPYVNGEIKGVPHEALFWRTTNGTSWCVRTPEAKFLLESHGATEPELYDMVNDPYESNNIIAERPEQRQQLAQLWNEWNAINETTFLLQSGNYQKKRLQMYEALHKELQEKAKKIQPITVE
ncbi:MAG: sulfatase-like hydrolase/transferase [Opitutales bacterium]|jgi:arylsulfatase A-like enzyme|nr:sulfatase-like hydrolase/transferase [Opitutales bacterium]MDP4644329.1 sulfatase-like hydrolase/transferase [Opitutales bacterium]MDP4778070.1 sulfatase-like hydrolase/transferase [Opitutales bacterium]MDP4883419.1 sulfatase-like hydrolase/transferase [Opitutales bacterium]MDP5079703.1 sulfatase-like hydrolase/transferase [Opitutales bacterium]